MEHATANGAGSIVRGKKLQLLAASLRHPEAVYSTDFNFFGAYIARRALLNQLTVWLRRPSAATQ
jgi:hypothetical protein